MTTVLGSKYTVGDLTWRISQLMDQNSRKDQEIKTLKATIQQKDEEISKLKGGNYKSMEEHNKALKAQNDIDKQTIKDLTNDVHCALEQVQGFKDMEQQINSLKDTVKQLEKVIAEKSKTKMIQKGSIE